MSGPRRPVLWALVVLAVLCAVGLAAWAWLAPPATSLSAWFKTSDKRPPSLETLGTYGEVPHFSLTERSGRPISRQDLLGKVWIVNFIYTRCTDTCPLQSAKMAQLHTEFMAEEDLRLVSISVDPEHDTPAVLAHYAKQHVAGAARWLFLTGDKRAIYRLVTEGFHLGVVGPHDQGHAKGWRPWTPKAALAHHGSNPFPLHSDRFVLVDRRARIRAYHRPDDQPSLERLRNNVRTLLVR